MSDEFNMPVKISKHETKPSWYVLDDSDFLVCSILDESEAKCVANAINCHDDMYAILLKIREINCPQEYLSEDELSALDEVESILSKVRGE